MIIIRNAINCEKTTIKNNTLKKKAAIKQTLIITLAKRLLRSTD